MTTEKLMIGICEHFDDGSQTQFKRLMNGYDVEFLEFKSPLDAAKSLLNGDIDLAGISGSSAFNLGFSAESNVSGLEISAYLPRREPTSVIVSKDKLDHLPRKGRVFANSELIRRQLKRFRTDLELCSKSDLNIEDLSQDNLIEKLDECGQKIIYAPDTLGNGDSCKPNKSLPDISYYAEAVKRQLEKLKR